MIDVGGYLVAHELRRDMALDAARLVIHILSYGRILHLRSYHTLARVVHLRHIAARRGAARLVAYRKAYLVQTAVRQTLPAVLARDAVQYFCIPTLLYPALAVARQTFVQVYADVRVRIGPGSIIYIYILIRILHTLSLLYFYGRVLAHLSHSHFYFRVQFALHVHFLGAGITRDVDIIYLHGLKSVNG